MRLIDADMLLNSFKGAKKLGVDAIKYYVDNTPTIDLVRCWECRHLNENYDDAGNPYWICVEWDASTDYDGYCYYGERRTDE